MTVKTKYSKAGVTTSDYIDQYCDHRKTCGYRGKQCKLFVWPARINKANIAYSHRKKCDDYRTIEDGIIGADVIELGVWRDRCMV